MVERRNVLSDHKKRGQMLVAPFNYLIGSMQDVSWIKTMIPELIWIALIQYGHGHQQGVKLITSMTRAVRSISPEADKKFLGPASAFSSLSELQARKLRETMLSTQELPAIQKSIGPLVSLYPVCPLRVVFDEVAPTASNEAIHIVSSAVSSLYNREDRDPMMVQATAIWLMFDAGKLKVSAGLALAKFPEIENYPATELSRSIGGAIRASLNGIFGSGELYPANSPWPRYFWNRGLEISPCEFSNGR